MKKFCIVMAIAIIVMVALIGKRSAQTINLNKITEKLTMPIRMVVEWDEKRKLAAFDDLMRSTNNVPVYQEWD